MGDVAASIHAGLRAAGIRDCIYLPDSVTGKLTASLERDPDMHVVVCAREDEGIAIASGLFIAGRRAIVVMECSGLGYSGLILARCQLQRTPVFVIASHGGTIGEPFDYHTAPIAAARGVVRGLNIDSIVLEPHMDHAETIRLAAESVYGQRTSLVAFLPPYLAAEPQTAAR